MLTQDQIKANWPEIKTHLLSCSYKEAYKNDPTNDIEELNKRLERMHSWVKLHQAQVNIANRIKNAEIEKAKETYQGMKKILEGMTRLFESIDIELRKKEWATCCNGRDCCCLGKPTEFEYYDFDLREQAREILKKLK